MKTKRIKFLGTEDRIGMIYDVLKAIASYGINIITMEANPYICFKIEWDENISFADFKRYIKDKVKEVTDVIEIDLMRYEKKERELNAVVNNVTEGIVAIDKNGNIVYLNKKAKKLFRLGENDLLGCHINKLIPKNIYNTEEDFQDKDNLEMNMLDIDKKHVNLLTDIRSIENEEGSKTGALVILREMDEVRQLINTINRPSMITFDDIIGNSQTLKNAIFLAKSVAPSNSSVMLRGESGTGKELFARAIHMSSRRNKYPFVAINCASVPDTLLESEFFGYEKGAFTGANSAGKQGLFELATRGTLFLDEIGDLSTHLQAKILRAIQEQKVRRLGGKNEIPIDIRIISATNRDLEKMIEDGGFREDLYYRLNVIPIYIPPLRERKEDIPVITDHFLKNLCKGKWGKNNIELTDEAKKQLIDYDWPGNIRELQNVIERATILANGKIHSEHLMIKTKKNPESYTEFLSANDDLPVNLPDILKKVESRYLSIACSKYKSSRDIAKALGISHTSVIKKMKEHNICKQ